MASALITTLIDKVDNFEAIRDQIAAILAIEAANQVALATTAAKPTPNEWALKVYTERSTPFELWLNEPDANTKLIPVIVVWFDTAGVDPGASNSIERQQYNGTFNIDCYAYGEAESNGAGFNAGDEAAARNAQRAARLVRNILKAAANIYLQLRGLVGSTRVRSITQFQPELEGSAIQNVSAVRLAFDVKYNEFSPQIEPETLENIFIEVKRDTDGAVLVDLDIDFTIPTLSDIPLASCVFVIGFQYPAGTTKGVNDLAAGGGTYNTWASRRAVVEDSSTVLTGASGSILSQYDEGGVNENCQISRKASEYDFTPLGIGQDVININVSRQNNQGTIPDRTDVYHVIVYKVGPLPAVNNPLYDMSYGGSWIAIGLVKVPAFINSGISLNLTGLVPAVSNVWIGTISLADYLNDFSDWEGVDTSSSLGVATAYDCP